MIIAYHGIFTTYGTWLPNDPRGSFSKKVYQEELAAIAPIQYGRQFPQPPTNKFRRFWTAATPNLKHPPYFIHNGTRPMVAAAMGEVVERLDLKVCACSIMNDHVHVIWSITDHKPLYVIGQFKGAATHELSLSLTPWARGGWKVYIDDEETLLAAQDYVEQNPAKSGLPPQRWEFVTPFRLG